MAVSEGVENVWRRQSQPFNLEEGGAGFIQLTNFLAPEKGIALANR